MADDVISSLVITDSAHAHPDHSLELVLNRLAQSPGLLPVVSRGDVHHVEGVITPQNLIEFVQRSGQSTDSTNHPKLA